MIKSRCHNLSDLMSTGQGKSPMDKYLDAKKQEEKIIESIQELGPKAQVTRAKHIASLTKLRAEILPMLEANKDEPHIGETAYKAARQLYRKAKYKRGRIQMQNKYTRKGIAVEQQSIEFFSIISGKYYQKNEQTFENDYLMGTPDMFLLNHISDPIENAEMIEDVKNTWDLDSFLEKQVMEDYETRYWWQLHGYMFLIPTIKKARVDYLLVDAPFDSIIREIKNASYEWEGEDKMPITEKFQIATNLLYSEASFVRFWEFWQPDFASSHEFQDMMADMFVEIPADQRAYQMPVLEQDLSIQQEIIERVKWMNRYIEKTFHFTA